ncbi:alpha/beta hydrolase family protein [Flavobacterium taihuense]|uniref:Prolyl oligopeptidase family serine peptidase n=1 Tax=Flavobacterium taihuense TaxID=2857508 RepID=A0ABS6XWI9_9FLAO|nr:prolyl oligopeptidase family serine peptidase [Flavobacterium taihuense]MBW4361048.1 prolyl oligopeptidase family serine peptidase [Flavobacterium taihuense]
MKKRCKAYQRFILESMGIYFLFLSCLMMGQVKQKKQLTAADYHLWSTLRTKTISDKGNWASYQLQYESKKDTLFVKSTKGNIRYAYPHGYEGSFNGEKWFGCKMHDTLVMQNLVTGDLQYTPNVSSFVFTKNGKYLLQFLKQAENKSELVIKDRKGKIAGRIADVSSWKLDATGNALVYCVDSVSHYSVGMLELGKTIVKRNIVTDTSKGFQNLSWRGNRIAFMQQDISNAKVFYYTTDDKKLIRFAPEGREDFPQDMQISMRNGSIMLSPDGERVFFELEENAVTPEASGTGVQIWNAADKLLYPNKQLFGAPAERNKLAVWWPKSNRFFQITDKKLPEGALNGDFTYAISYDPLAYEPQSNYDGVRDIFITELSTGKRKMILEKHSGDIMTLLMSPNGKYISYPKAGSWWVYDIAKETHTNITENLSVSFFNEQYDRPSDPMAYGNPGWTANDQSILLYDEFDIWEVSPDGSSRVRLTRGREKGISFRIKPLNAQQQTKTDAYELHTGQFHFNDQLILEAHEKSTGSSGYYSWNRREGAKPLVWEAKKTNQFLKAVNSDAFLYVVQSYECAPRIVFQSDFKARGRELVQSNPQQEDYHWGKAEQIHYTVKGKQLSGLLIYPADYQIGKRYPMVVQIYQRQFQYLHDYSNPTVFEEGGFNISNFSAQGYFVLRPDIVYELGEVGSSATACVLAATDAVIAKGLVDPSKIGLIGHSFGGYETDFIITQTDRFATAIAGAAWTDLVSAYLYIGGNYQKPDFWRAEYDQLRVGKSLFEDTESYLRNSSVLQAANVHTPLLAWTGAEDRHVNYYQSIEFYLALRRLGKTHTMLIYPGEGHILVDGSHQKDLTQRTEEWFGYYLKNEPLKSWMVADPH